MGGAVSAGADNDELVDNLVEANYIKTSTVEGVFRAVDRAHYFTSECKNSAYNDLAWKSGNLHISAPCIYSEVLENLKLAPGMSFLNLGSGTGYLSTMAGLILGSNGVNHGIELYGDVMKYAVDRLEEFCITSPAVDEFEFCQPSFVNGNCLFLGSEVRQYDRVYCGAACPEHHENYMRNLIKVGGILVMPINDQLLQISRISDTNWETKPVLPVSFATLVCNSASGSSEPLKMPDADPLSLQDICRYAVRSILRRIIDVEHPELKKRHPRLPRKRVKKRTLRRLVIPIFDSHSDSEENESELVDHRRRDMGRGGFLMDVHNVQTCTSIVELHRILRETGRSSPGAENFPRRGPPGMKGITLIKEREETERDDASDAINERESVQKEVEENMSEDEYLSDLEEENISSIKAAEPESSNTEERTKALEKEPEVETNCDVKQKGKVKVKGTKREKFDSGIVEDIEGGKMVSSDSDHDGEDDGGEEDEVEDDDDEDDEDDEEDEEMDTELTNAFHRDLKQNSGLTSAGFSFMRVLESDTDTDNFENAAEKEAEDKITNINQPVANDASPINVNNYSSYMKEKIKNLPLPMTLKYFLNLNREL